MVVAVKPETYNLVIDRVVQELGVELSPEQEALVYSQAREVLGGGGERAGKSFVASQYLNVRVWGDDLYWIAGKDYDRCHAEFEYTAKAMQKLGFVASVDIHTPQNAQWWMRILRTKDEPDGRLIKTWSLKDWLKVGSEAPGGIVVCEIAQITYPEYTRLTDRTAEKRGWVVGTGTFEGSMGWFPELFKLYLLPGQHGEAFSLPSWSNLHVYPDGENDPEIIRLKEKYKEDPDYFNERFGGIPAPPHGLVFKEFRYLTHVKELSIQESPVYLWVDPGYAGAYAVEVVQIINDTVHIVDEIYEQELVTEEITKIVMQKPWFRLIAGGAIDIAAKQHQAMPAVAEIWASQRNDGWPGIPLQTNYVEEPVGRERLHSFLTVNPLDHQPRLFIDPKCKGILSEFGAVPNPFTGEAAPYKWKEDRAGLLTGVAPEDKNNHGIKAVIYGLISRYGYVTRNGKGGMRTRRFR